MAVKPCWITVLNALAVGACPLDGFYSQQQVGRDLWQGRARARAAGGFGSAGSVAEREQ